MAIKKNNKHVARTVDSLILTHIKCVVVASLWAWTHQLVALSDQQFIIHNSKIHPVSFRLLSCTINNSTMHFKKISKLSQTPWCVGHTTQVSIHNSLWVSQEENSTVMWRIWMSLYWRDAWSSRQGAMSRPWNCFSDVTLDIFWRFVSNTRPL